MERKDELTLLGNKKTVYKQDYAPEVLESFVNKHPENDYWVRFNCPEFTSLADYGAAGFCGNPYQLPAGCEDGGKQELEAVFVQFP